MAVGDQIFTDCIAAHRAGIRFAIVKPIQPVESKFFRIKRFFERPFVRKLDWLNPKNALQKIRNRKKKAKDKE
jgi:predicted HAD superfamily phosphohydrolase YqeG